MTWRGPCSSKPTRSGPDVPPDGTGQAFIVVVTDAGQGDEVITRISSLPDRHQIAQGIWLIRSSLLVKELSDVLGLGDVQVGTGIVFRLNGTYWGRANQNTWDWLSRARQTT